MSDAAQFLGILTALVVVFAAVRLPAGGALFLTRFGSEPRRWLGADDVAFRTPNGSLVLGNLTPFGRSCTGAPWPTAVSPEGLAPPLDHPPPWAFVPFERLHAVTTDGNRLLIDGREWARCGSPGAATRWAGRLETLRGLPPGERGDRIRALLADDCDPASAAAAFGRAEEEVRGVRALSQTLFLFCYGLLIAATAWDVLPSLPLAAACYLTLAAGLWFRRRRALLRLAAAPELADPPAPAGTPADPPAEASAKPALGGGWVLFVSPADAFRAADALLRPPLDRFHPAALAVATCGADRAEPLVRLTRRAALHPPPDGAADETDAGRARAWFAATTAEVIADLYGAGEPAAPPPDPDAVAFCPRCEGQYVRDGNCPACRAALRAFPAPERPEAAADRPALSAP